MRSQLCGRTRLTHAQHGILNLLRAHRAISYDEIAARLDIDRKTAIQGVRRLVLLGQVRMEMGRGRRPNQYELVGN